MSARKRNDHPTRFRKLRDDASIASVQKTIEGKLGLPVGSVKLVYPGGRKVRVDSNVGKLKATWK
jgi:hypothetical protein